jgi:hypothetical protein
MELAQWIFARDDGSFGTAFAPAAAERVELPRDVARRLAGDASSADAAGEATTLRRRGPLVSSHWLSHPLALAASPRTTSLEGSPLDAGPAVGPGATSLHVRFEVDGRGGSAIAAPGTSDIATAGLLAEYVQVAADLLDAAGLRPAWIGVAPEGRGLDVIWTGLAAKPVAVVVDAVCVARAALEVSAHARGLLLTEARVALGSHGLQVVDAHLVGQTFRDGAPR